jgi:hypothetical protein
MKDNSIQPKSSFKETKKRSSLKNNSNILDPHKIINYKRNSVSFNLESVKKFKKLKFDIGEIKPEEKKILVEKKKKFEEVRRQSVKNEFNLVRDFLKNKNFDDLEDDDVKENTKKNITMGKEGLKSIESDSEDSVSDSHSSEENKSEKSEKSENSKEEKKKEKSKEEKSDDEKKEEIKKKENALNNKIKEFENKEKEFEKKIKDFEKKVEDFEKK